jgi:hypothetical protein
LQSSFAAGAAVPAGVAALPAPGDDAGAAAASEGALALPALGGFGVDLLGIGGCPPWVSPRAQARVIAAAAAARNQDDRFTRMSVVRDQ